MEASAEVPERMAGARKSYAAIKAELARVVVGHDALIEQVFIALVCGGHCLLEGVPGLGKTLMVRSLAAALNLSFSRIQFTPDLMPADITGTQMLTEDAVGAARSDAGAECDCGRQGAPAGEPVHGAGDAESHRDGRHLSTSRSAGGPG